MNIVMNIYLRLKLYVRQSHPVNFQRRDWLKGEIDNTVE